MKQEFIEGQIGDDITSLTVNDWLIRPSYWLADWLIVLSRESAGNVRRHAVLAVGGPGLPRPGHHQDLSGSIPPISVADPEPVP
jgi:hypothetical protein